MTPFRLRDDGRPARPRVVTAAGRAAEKGEESVMTPFRLANWATVVDDDLPDLTALRRDHVNRGRPLGPAEWTETTAARLGLGSSLRPVGRPRKAKNQ